MSSLPWVMGEPMKQHGSKPLEDFGLKCGNATTLRIRKRSLRRAYRRLRVHGVTWYRGHFWQQQVAQPSPSTFVVEPSKSASSQPQGIFLNIDLLFGVGMQGLHRLPVTKNYCDKFDLYTQFENCCRHRLEL